MLAPNPEAAPVTTATLFFNLTIAVSELKNPTRPASAGIAPKQVNVDSERRLFHFLSLDQLDSDITRTADETTMRWPMPDLIEINFSASEGL
jgi:hypothetical protein